MNRTSHFKWDPLETPKTRRLGGGISEPALFVPIQYYQQSFPQLVIIPEENIPQIHKNLLFFYNSSDVLIYNPTYPMPWINAAQTASAEQVFLLASEQVDKQVLSPKNFQSTQYHLISDWKFLENPSHWAENMGYSKSLFVENPKEYRFQGGVLDIFSPQSDTPVRCEVEDKTLVKIYKLNPKTQQTEAIQTKYTVIDLKKYEALKNSYQAGEKTTNLLEYFKAPLVIWSSIKQPIDNFKYKAESHIFYFNIVGSLEAPTVPLEISSLKKWQSEFGRKTAKEQQNYIEKTFLNWIEKHHTIIISCKTYTEKVRLQTFLQDTKITVRDWEENNISLSELIYKDQSKDRHNSFHVYIRSKNIQESLVYQKEKLVFINASNLIGTQNKKERVEHVTLKNKIRGFSLETLKSGDLITHVDHGIGKYVKTIVTQQNSHDEEFIQIGYKDGDLLYIPIYKINLLQKYIGHTQHLDKLGGHRWDVSKQRVKKYLQDIALDLLRLEAHRKSLTRPALPLEGDMYHEFEKQCPFVETKDQRKATDHMLEDLKKTYAMDRLLCGDVGFGKTEIGFRASFRAIENNMQVAVLVPTTVLSFQHKKSFEKRFAPWKIRVSMINRFVSLKRQKEILSSVKNGEIDILIGTHKLLNPNIEFKNLGLLIIDEEQKFGVKHKQKVKLIKNRVDTLSLSATPIPRTLHMSLVGLRDISLIQTPPQNRLAIKTEIHQFNKTIIKKALEFEKQRGGQTFFLHNRIENIQAVTETLSQLCPTLNICYVHGQMTSQNIEKVMLDFYENKIDVLVCTSIIESGLDIPNTNTLIVNHAHMFGLSQLYQIRGRVGRSHQKAYCYLLIPKDKKIETVAMERLQTIQNFTELGSGIHVAQKDLELRGAGDLLGEEQSGHMNAVGHELYLDLLEEVIAENKSKDEKKRVEKDPDVHLPYACLIPQNYIRDIRTRLYYYRALSFVEHETDLDEVEEELRSAFGVPPEEVLNLLGLSLIKSLCQKIGIKNVRVQKTSVKIDFSKKTIISPETVTQLLKQKGAKHRMLSPYSMRIQVTNNSWIHIYNELKELA